MTNDILSALPPVVEAPGDQEGELERYAALGRSCEANGLAGFGHNGDPDAMWFQPPDDIIAENAVERYIAARAEGRPSPEPEPVQGELSQSDPRDTAWSRGQHSAGPWACYHCSFTAHTHEEAREHFGPDRWAYAACQAVTTHRERIERIIGDPKVSGKVMLLLEAEAKQALSEPVQGGAAERLKDDAYAEGFRAGLKHAEDTKAVWISERVREGIEAALSEPVQELQGLAEAMTWAEAEARSLECWGSAKGVSFAERKRHRQSAKHLRLIIRALSPSSGLEQNQQDKASQGSVTATRSALPLDAVRSEGEP